MQIIARWRLGTLILLLLPALMSAETAGPRVFQCDGADLLSFKQRAQSGDSRAADLVAVVTKEADKALNAGPFSVTSKAFTPPTGDKHDYMSLSPYWWPDPSKPDGKPYMRKDGEYNPERSKYDLDPMEQMCDAVGALAMGYYFTGNEAYATKAAELIRAWFFDDATKMNPNLRYAQFIPGRDDVRGAGVIEGNRFRKVVDADGLLQGSKSWSAEDSAKLKAWFKELLNYLQTSEQGRKEAEAPNNHGTWYAVQTATYALYTGDEALAKEILTRYGRDRIARQIEPDGSQPEELQRTRAYDYTRYNILAHEDCAMLADRLGIDYWNFKTDDGRSLRLAIDWFLPYAIGEKKWQHQQITPPKMKETAAVLRRAANAYHEPKYEAAIKKLEGVDKVPEMTEVMFPAKQ
jgi:hypothetical protein